MKRLLLICNVHLNNSKTVSHCSNKCYPKISETLLRFTTDKERDVESVTYRLRKDLEMEERKQADLRKEIQSLHDQLQESKNGLLAATRITDQLETCQVANSTLKAECEYEFFFI